MNAFIVHSILRSIPGGYPALSDHSGFENGLFQTGLTIANHPNGCAPLMEGTGVKGEMVWTDLITRSGAAFSDGPDGKSGLVKTSSTSDDSRGRNDIRGLL